jgi:hypothetical protein
MVQMSYADKSHQNGDHMKSLCFGALGVILCFTAAASSAETFQLSSTYTTNGSTVTGSVSGSVNIDPATGLFGNVTLMGTDGVIPLTFLGGPSSQAPFYGSSSATYTQYSGFYLDTTGLYTIDIDVPAIGGSLVGYAGGPLCSYADLSCKYQGNSFVGYLIGPAGETLTLAGSLTNPTPEPSTLALLSTGIGLLATFRRRLAR